MSQNASASVATGQIDDREYKRRIRAWTMYDWANSAFVTTTMAAVLPVYYSQVAGSTLPSDAAATALWSLGLSISLFITALISPVLGTISDVMRGKKRFLSFFLMMGVVGAGLLVLVSTGDWLLASLLFILGRIGFTSANVFYDALLPHVAKEADQDSVSTRGYAMGYLGGGLLLAINVVMIQVVPDFFEYAGIRLSLLSVAIWWAIFSYPILTRVPEPPAVERALKPGQSVLSASFEQIRETLSDIQRYKELFKFLIAFLIYNDGIGTIIGVAVIYGAELGFQTTELILALLLVQFVGIPFSLIFGRIPSKDTKYRPQFVAFVVFNIIALPLVGVLGANMLAQDLTGAQPAPFVDTADAVGEGAYHAEGEHFVYSGNWDENLIPADTLSGGAFFEFINRIFGDPLSDEVYMESTEANASFDFAFNGQEVTLTYGTGPDYAEWDIMLDGQPYRDEDGELANSLNATTEIVRYGTTQAFMADEPGEHVLTITSSGADGETIAVAMAEVQPPVRKSNLVMILLIVVATQVVGAGFAALFGRPLFSGLAATLDTKRAVIMSLVVYAVIAVWGYFLNSTIEFWFLAWMVAIVQGGSQALSRSLYAGMSPAAKSGEFFGLFGVMEKFSAILGPLLFAAAGAIFASSRPAILSLIVFFIVGIALLTRVDVDEGKRVAQAEDAALLG